MIKSDIQVTVLKSEKLLNETRWIIKFSNPTEKIQFFIHSQLAIGEEEILPSFWSANYFTLAPGESLTITVGCPPASINGGVPMLKVGGWNVEESAIPLTIAK
jgi:hypothetical protein